MRRFRLHFADQPTTILKMGSSLNPDDIKEGDDAYFECIVQSNPKPYKMSWFHNVSYNYYVCHSLMKRLTQTSTTTTSHTHPQGKELQHNISVGIILSDQSLVLQSVSRASAGAYTCLAVNSEGKGLSNPVTLRIRCK